MKLFVACLSHPKDKKLKMVFCFSFLIFDASPPKQPTQEREEKRREERGVREGGSSLKQIREKLHYSTVQYNSRKTFKFIIFYYVYDLHHHFLMITNFSKEKSIVIDG